MRILFHLGHPAHFHLFKHVIEKLKNDGTVVDILIKEKDVLKVLLDRAGFTYTNILQEGRTPGNFGRVKDLFRRGKRMIAWCKENRPDLLIGTSVDISYVGKYLDIPAVNVTEDDAKAVPLYAWIAYPWAIAILTPDSCDNGRWNRKATFYSGYHELAYLHPELFLPDKNTVTKLTDPDKAYFILRFSGLNAHHDNGIQGISDHVAMELINKLKPHGDIFITSERPLAKEFEPYRLSVDPSDIHHVLAYAKLVIGDSQTMSAEAAVLGTPYIRCNDFVGRIGYLRELEEKYQLGFGFRPDEKDRMLQKVEKLAVADNTAELFQQRRQAMLADKINVADFIYDYISNRKWMQ